MKNSEYKTLTKDNAHTASLVRHKNHPEWGMKRFEYKAQKLVEGRTAHIWGQKVVFDSELENYEIITTK